MTAMLESQIALKLLTKSFLFLSYKRIAKVIKKANIIEIGKVIYNIRNYCKIKIAEDTIEQKQSVNCSIWKAEIQSSFNVRPKLRFLGCWGSGLSDFWSAGVLKKYPLNNILNLKTSR